MEPHSTFWGCWPSAPPYWAILEKVHERKNLPRQRRKSISSCIWSRGHNNLIKISRTIKGLHCLFLTASFYYRGPRNNNIVWNNHNLKHISCHVWQEIICFSYTSDRNVFPGWPVYEMFQRAGMREGATPTSISILILNSYDVKTLFYEFVHDIFTGFTLNLEVFNFNS